MAGVPAAEEEELKRHPHNSIEARFGRRLAEVRRAKGMTQKQLTEKAKIGVRSFIAQLEVGWSGVTLAHVKALARGLGVSVSYLMKGVK